MLAYCQPAIAAKLHEAKSFVHLHLLSKLGGIMTGKPSVARCCIATLMASALMFTIVCTTALPKSNGQEAISSVPKNANGQEKEPPKKNPAKPAGAVEIRFVDGSTMKLLLRDTKIELETDYGKLLIPVAEIQRIEFGLRMSDETRKKIDAAIADLSSSDFRRRQVASTDLLALKEKAYPALMRVASGKDAEASRRVEQIMEKLREDLPPDESLNIPLHDTIHTANSKVVGHIKVESLRVSTLPFGDQQAKLADMRSLHTQSAIRTDQPSPTGLILPDPGSLGMYANQVGKTLSFRVVGPQPGMAAQMGVFGTDVYTLDSSLMGAALHAGVVRPGQTAVVRVTILGVHPAFPGSMRNGVMSHNYGPWGGFRIEQPKGGGQKKD
jgi:hypothetical protein